MRRLPKLVIALALAPLTLGALAVIPAPEADANYRPAYADDPPEFLGAQYTQWFYNGQLEELRARFTTHMHESMGQDAFSAFYQSFAANFGEEEDVLEEDVHAQGGLHVYRRTVRIQGAPVPVEIQWTLTDHGNIAGLFMRPHTPPAL